RPVEVQLPQLTTLTINGEYRRTSTYHLVTDTTIDIEAVLVEGTDLIGPRLQLQALVSGTETPVGRRNLLTIDALHFQLVGHHYGECLPVRQRCPGVELHMGLLSAGG